MKNNTVQSNSKNDYMKEIAQVIANDASLVSFVNNIGHNERISQIIAKDKKYKEYRKEIANLTKNQKEAIQKVLNVCRDYFFDYGFTEGINSLSNK